MVAKQINTNFDSTMQGITVTHQKQDGCKTKTLDEKSQFLVPTTATTNDNGGRLSRTEIQQLKWHSNAPKHVQEWSHTFDVTQDHGNTFTEITSDVLKTYGHVEATFHPEPTIGGKPRKTDTTWTITAPLEYALVNSTTLAERDSYESDRIAQFRYAPDIVKNWGSYTGWPFSVEINHVKIANETLTIEETTQFLSDSNHDN